MTLKVCRNAGIPLEKHIVRNTGRPQSEWWGGRDGRHGKLALFYFICVDGKSLKFPVASPFLTGYSKIMIFSPKGTKSYSKRSTTECKKHLEIDKNPSRVREEQSRIYLLGPER